MSKIIIQSEQVYFRLICYDDIDNGWLDWINNPTLNKYLVSSTITRSDLIRYLDDSKPPLVYMFAVCLIENDRYIGNARLSLVDRINKKCIYGRLLGGENVHGRGIGTEVLILLANYAFYILNLNKIETQVIAKNIASVRSNIKAGAIQEGLLRESEIINGTYEDVACFGILRSDYNKGNGKKLL
jgi:RimJ/RimL family protein N-acetyltransferase